MPRRAAPAFCNQAIQLYLPLPSPQSRTHRLINCVVYGHGLGGAPFLVHSQSHITVEAASKHPTRASGLVAHMVLLRYHIRFWWGRTCGRGPRWPVVAHPGLSCTRTHKEGGNLKHTQAATRSTGVRYNAPMYNPVHVQLKRGNCQLLLLFFCLPARPPSLLASPCHRHPGIKTPADSFC